MTENKRLLNKCNNILQNQNICYADGEEQAKKHLEQFKQNLIESFNEAELREEFIDECNDTEKQESIKLENVDSLFAYKRFHFGYVCGDTGLIDEQAELKWFIENCCSIKDLKKNWKTVCNKLNELNEENEELKHHLSELQGENEILNKENEILKEENKKLQGQMDTQKLINKSLKINEEYNKKAIQKLNVQKLEIRKYVNDKISYLEKKYEFGQTEYKGCPMHNIQFGINILKELREYWEEQEND